MTKQQKMIHNLTAFLLLLLADGIVTQGLLLLTNSSLFAGAAWTDVLRAVLLLACNLLWAILLGLLMVACFSKGQSPLANSAFDPALPFMKRFEVPALLLFLLIQLVGDAVSSLVGQYLATVLVWLAGYRLFTWKKPGFFSKPKLLTTALIVLIAAAAGTHIAESVLLRAMTGMRQPAMDSIFEYIRYLEVTQKVTAILSLACSAIVGCTVICLHVHAANGSEKENTSAQ